MVSFQSILDQCSVVYPGSRRADAYSSMGILPGALFVHIAYLLPSCGKNIIIDSYSLRSAYYTGAYRGTLSYNFLFGRHKKLGTNRREKALISPTFILIITLDAHFLYYHTSLTLLSLRIHFIPQLFQHVAEVGSFLAQPTLNSRLSRCP